MKFDISHSRIMSCRIFSCAIAVLFSLNSLSLPAYAAESAVLNLPQPGAMVGPSPAFESLAIKGLRVHPENPLLFDFVIDPGNTTFKAQDAQVRVESERLIKYFLACLTIPENDLWVNLSPYEKDRMIPQSLGQTELGRDMLAQDYILKQLTSSLIYPEKQLGKDFWQRVYTKAQQVYGTTQIPVNTFNKVWVLADTAKIYEHKDTAYLVNTHLKIMLDEDYLAREKATNAKAPRVNPQTNSIGSQIVRDLILPEIEKEVNTGKNFAPLRQIYSSFILAAWYKKNLKSALLNQVYADKAKVNNLNVIPAQAGIQQLSPEQIYQRYVQAYKKGVFNYIKEEAAPGSADTVPHKYFSGGARLTVEELNTATTPAQLSIGEVERVHQLDQNAFLATATMAENSATAPALQPATQVDPTSIPIWIYEPDKDRAEMFKEALDATGYRPLLFSSKDELVKGVRNADHPAVVVVALEFNTKLADQDQVGIKTVDELRDLNKNIQVVLSSGRFDGAPQQAEGYIKVGNTFFLRDLPGIISNYAATLSSSAMHPTTPQAATSLINPKDVAVWIYEPDPSVLSTHTEVLRRRGYTNVKAFNTRDALVTQASNTEHPTVAFIALEGRKGSPGKQTVDQLMALNKKNIQVVMTSGSYADMQKQPDGSFTLGNPDFFAYMKNIISYAAASFSQENIIPAEAFRAPIGTPMRVYDSKQQTADAVADGVISELDQNNIINAPTLLGGFTGNTAIPVWEALRKKLAARKAANNPVSLRNVVIYNLDEYVGRSIYRKFMHTNLIDWLMANTDFDANNFHIPDGMGDPYGIAEEYEKSFRRQVLQTQIKYGTVLMLAGIGVHSHTAFNEEIEDLSRQGLEYFLRAENKTYKNLVDMNEFILPDDVSSYDIIKQLLVMRAAQIENLETYFKAFETFKQFPDDIQKQLIAGIKHHLTHVPVVFYTNDDTKIAQLQNGFDPRRVSIRSAAGIEKAGTRVVGLALTTMLAEGNIADLKDDIIAQKGPFLAISMGPGNFLSADRVFDVALGDSKAPAIWKATMQKDRRYSGSLLPSRTTTFFVDKLAASMVPRPGRKLPPASVAASSAMNPAASLINPKDMAVWIYEPKESTLGPQLMVLAYKGYKNVKIFDTDQFSRDDFVDQVAAAEHPILAIVALEYNSRILDDAEQIGQKIVQKIASLQKSNVFTVLTSGAIFQTDMQGDRSFTLGNASFVSGIINVISYCAALASGPVVPAAKETSLDGGGRIKFFSEQEHTAAAAEAIIRELDRNNAIGAYTLLGGFSGDISQGILEQLKKQLNARKAAGNPVSFEKVFIVDLNNHARRSPDAAFMQEVTGVLTAYDPRFKQDHVFFPKTESGAQPVGFQFKNFIHDMNEGKSGAEGRTGFVVWGNSALAMNMGPREMSQIDRVLMVSAFSQESAAIHGASMLKSILGYPDRLAFFFALPAESASAAMNAALLKGTFDYKSMDDMAVLKDLIKIEQDRYTQARQNRARGRAANTLYPSFLYGNTGRGNGVHIGVDISGTNGRVNVQIIKNGIVVLEIPGDRFSWDKDENGEERGLKFKDPGGPDPYKRIAQGILKSIEEAKKKGLEFGVVSIGVSWADGIAKTSKNRGEIISLSKGWEKRPELIGLDPAKTLETTLSDLKKKDKSLGKLIFKVRAVMNDTEATLYNVVGATGGGITGTGQNDAAKDAEQDGMIVNFQNGSNDPSETLLGPDEKAMLKFFVDRKEKENKYERLMTSSGLTETMRQYLLRRSSDIENPMIKEKIQNPEIFMKNYPSTLGRVAEDYLNGRIEAAAGLLATFFSLEGQEVAKEDVEKDLPLIVEAILLKSNKAAQLVAMKVFTSLEIADPKFEKLTTQGILWPRDGSVFWQFPLFKERVAFHLEHIIDLQKGKKIKVETYEKTSLEGLKAKPDVFTFVHITNATSRGVGIASAEDESLYFDALAKTVKGYDDIQHAAPTRLNDFWKNVVSPLKRSRGVIKDFIDEPGDLINKVKRFSDTSNPDDLSKYRIHLLLQALNRQSQRLKREGKENVANQLIALILSAQHANNAQASAVPKQQSPTASPAMPGGIDLKASDLKIDMDKQGGAVVMKPDAAMLARFEANDFTGVKPVILRIISTRGQLNSLDF